MSRLEHAAEVADLAIDLGLGGAANPVDAILRHCRTRVDRWVAEAPGVTNIGQLEALVTQRLQMVFEEVRSDADFDCIKEQYARAKKDPVFAAMQFRFDDAEDPTYGTLVRRKNVAADNPEIVQRLGRLAKRHVLEGRSTPGAAAPPPAEWPQIAWISQF